MCNRLNALCFGVLLALLSLATRPVIADQLNKRTVFEFQTPVEVSGKMLAPGKYVFQIADTSDLNVVQVLSKDPNGKEKLIDTIATSPEYIDFTPNRAIVNLEKGHAGREVVRSWFYAGDNWGWKFNYPRNDN